jgi:hypothetical protein
MDNRLLSENEITLIVGWPSAFEYAKIVELNKSQLAKTDKEWVEWFESYCTEHDHLYPNHKRSECSKCWQEHKKELGI